MIEEALASGRERPCFDDPWECRKDSPTRRWGRSMTAVFRRGLKPAPYFAVLEVLFFLLHFFP